MRNLAAIAILIAACVDAAVTPVWTQTTQTKEQSFVEGLVQRMLSSEGRRLKITGLRVDLTGNVAAARIEVHDEKGAWLSLEEAVLDWQPLTLLSSTLKVNELKAKRISVARIPLAGPAPETPEEAENVGGVTVDKLTIDALKVGSAVFGRAVTIAADGSLQITQDPRVVTVKLSAKHTDDVDGRLDATLSYTDRTEQLTVDVTLDEAGGGALAALLPIDDDARVNLSVSGTGKIDDWKGKLRFAVDGAAVIDGEAGIKGAGDRQTLSLDLAGAFDALTPDGYDELFAGRSELSLAVRRTAGKPITLERAELKSQSVSVSAKGTIDPEGEGTSLDAEFLTLTGKPISVDLAGVPFGRFSFTSVGIGARLEGPLERPNWAVAARAGAVSAAGATARDLRLDASGSGFAPGPESATDLKLSVKGAMEPGESGALPPLFAGAFAANLGLKLATTGIDISAANIKAEHYALTASGRYGFEDAGYALDLDLTAQSPKTGNPRVDLLLQGPVRLSGKVSGQSLKTIDFEDAAFSSDVLQARIDGRYDTDGATALTAEATVPRLELLHAGAEGRLVTEARLEGRFEELTVDITGRGENVSVAGRRLDDLTLKVAGTLDSSVPNMAIALGGDLAGEPLRFDAKLTGTDAGALQLNDITGRFGPAALEGALALAPDGMPDGAVTLEIADLAAASDPALQGLRGSLRARVALSSADGRARANIDLNGRGLARDDIYVSALSAEIAVDDLLGTPAVSGNGALEDARAGGVDLGTVDIDAKALEKRGYLLNLSERGGKWTARSELDVSAGGEATVVTLETFKFVAQGRSIDLKKPTTLRIASDAVVLARTELGADGGAVVAEGTLSPELDFRATLDRLPLSVLTPVLPDLAITGAVSGRVVATGPVASPRAEVSLKGSGISVDALRRQGVAAVSVELDGTLSDQVMTLKGRVREGKTSLAVSGSVGFEGAGRLDLGLTGTLPSGLLARIGARNGLIVKGAVRVEVKVRGTFDTPVYAGTLTTSGATVADADGRFTARNVTARLILDGQKLRVERFSGATAGGDGRIAVAGVVALDGGVATRLDITVTKGRYSDGTLLVTRFNAMLTLRGSIGGRLTLAGTVDLLQPRVTLSEPLPADLAPVTVKHRRAPADVRRQQRALAKKDGAGAAGGLILDIELRTADRIVVTGRGINAELGGSLRLTGPAAAPNAFGAFRLRRGTVKLLSRKIEFSQGELDFTGDLNPRIRFVGSVRTDQATITLTISGRADAPRVTVSSAPELPQEEAMALLVFGRSIAELSPLQVAQLAGSVALLSGGSGGGLFDGLKGLLGSTNVEIVRTEGGETAVSVGSQINDRLSVGVQQETSTGKRRIEIDLDLTRRFKLRGSVGDDGSTRTGIFFEKEY